MITHSHATNVNQMLSLQGMIRCFAKCVRDMPDTYGAWNCTTSERYQVYLKHIQLPQRFFLPSLLALQQIFHIKFLLKIPIKNTKRDRSDDFGSDAIGLPRPVQQPGKAAYRCALMSVLKCAGTPPCWNQMRWWKSIGTPFSISGRISYKNVR